MDWDWQKGEPRVQSLAPARRTRADALSRHAPVNMWSLTTGTPLLLDSGLEYELARELDRDRDVTWIVAQPVLLTFADGSRHVPDLLSAHADGGVTIWDARPDERRDEKFLRTVELTRQVCSAVGWRYELYAGAETARRMNVLWLGTFRHRPDWPHHTARARLLARAESPVSVSELMALDDGDGHLIATMWHLMWTGDLVIDLDSRIRPDSLVHRLAVPRD